MIKRLQKQAYFGDSIVIIGSLIITVLMTWPLVLHLNSHIFGDHGDNFEYLWKIWWFKHAIFDLHTSPWVVPHIYYPTGYALSYGEITPLNTIFTLPVTAVIGATAVYNLSLLVSTPLNAWLMYRLATRLLRRVPGDATARLAGAVFAAALFTFSPFRQIRLWGHLPLVHTEGLVLALLGLDRWLENRHYRDAALFALGISLATLASWYYAVLLLMTMPVYVLAYDPHPWRWLTQRQTWLGVGAALIILVLVVVPFMLPYRTVIGDNAYDLGDNEAIYYSAQLFDYLSPNFMNPWYGTYFRDLFWLNPARFTSEHYVSLGWVGLLFTLLGLHRARGASFRALRWLALVGIGIESGSRIPLCQRLHKNSPAGQGVAAVDPAVGGNARLGAIFGYGVACAQCDCRSRGGPVVKFAGQTASAGRDRDHHGHAGAFTLAVRRAY